MKQQVRELLVTAKVAQHWSDKQVYGAGELLDVYHKTKQTPAKLRKKKQHDASLKPFEFFVFRN